MIAKALQLLDAEKAVNIEIRAIIQEKSYRATDDAVYESVIDWTYWAANHAFGSFPWRVHEALLQLLLPLLATH